MTSITPLMCSALSTVVPGGLGGGVGGGVGGGGGVGAGRAGVGGGAVAAPTARLVGAGPHRGVGGVAVLELAVTVRVGAGGPVPGRVRPAARAQAAEGHRGRRVRVELPAGHHVAALAREPVGVLARGQVRQVRAHGPGGGGGVALGAQGRRRVEVGVAAPVSPGGAVAARTVDVGVDDAVDVGRLGGGAGGGPRLGVARVAVAAGVYLRVRCGRRISVAAIARRAGG